MEDFCPGYKDGMSHQINYKAGLGRQVLKYKLSMNWKKNASVR